MFRAGVGHLMPGNRFTVLVSSFSLSRVAFGFLGSSPKRSTMLILIDIADITGAFLVTRLLLNETRNPLWIRIVACLWFGWFVFRLTRSLISWLRSS